MAADFGGSPLELLKTQEGERTLLLRNFNYDCVKKTFWNAPVINGQSCFFTEESYDRYICNNENNLGLQEYFQRKTGDILQGFSSQQFGASKTSQGGPRKEVVLSNTELAAASGSHDSPGNLELTRKGNLRNIGRTNRAAFPRKSWLTCEEQKRYLELSTKYSNSLPINPTEQERIEINILQDLQTKVTPEQEEFQTYLRQISESSQHYSSLNPQAKKYIEEKVRHQCGRVKDYPRYYETVDALSLSIPDDLKEFPPLTYHLTLLELGCVPKVILPNLQSGNRPPLPVDYVRVSQSYPTKTLKCQPDTWNKQTCSQDWNAERLATKYGCNVVISSAGLKCLLDNHTPGFDRDWQLPFVIRELPLQDGPNSSNQKVIYIDKPFVSQRMTVRQKSDKFHKVALKTLICHRSKSYKFGSNKSETVSAIHKKADKKMNKSGKSNEKVFKDGVVDHLFGCSNVELDDLETFGMTSGFLRDKSVDVDIKKVKSLKKKDQVTEHKKNESKGDITTTGIGRRNKVSEPSGNQQSPSCSETKSNDVIPSQSNSQNIPEMKGACTPRVHRSDRSTNTTETPSPDTSPAHIESDTGSTMTADCAEILVNDKPEKLIEDIKGGLKVPVSVNKCLENPCRSPVENPPMGKGCTANTATDVTTSQALKPSKENLKSVSGLDQGKLVSTNSIENNSEHLSNISTSISSYKLSEVVKISSEQSSDNSAAHQIEDKKNSKNEARVMLLEVKDSRISGVVVKDSRISGDVEHPELGCGNHVTQKLVKSSCEHIAKVHVLDSIVVQSEEQTTIVRKVRGRPRKATSTVTKVSPCLSRQDHVSCDSDIKDCDVSHGDKSRVTHSTNLPKISLLRRSPRGLGRISDSEGSTFSLTLSKSTDNTNSEKVPGLNVIESASKRQFSEQSGCTDETECSKPSMQLPKPVDTSPLSAKLRLRSTKKCPTMVSDTGKQEFSDTEDDCLVIDLPDSMLMETKPIPRRRSKRIAAHGANAESTDTDVSDIPENLHKRGRRNSFTKTSEVNKSSMESPECCPDIRRSGRLTNSDNSTVAINRSKEDNLTQVISGENNVLIKLRKHSLDNTSLLNDEKESKGDDIMFSENESVVNTSSDIGELTIKVDDKDSTMEMGGRVGGDLSHIAEIQEPSDLSEVDQECSNPVIIPLSPAYHPIGLSTQPVIIPTDRLVENTDSSPTKAPRTTRPSQGRGGMKSAVKHKAEDPLSAILNLQNRMLHQPSISNRDLSDQHSLQNITKTTSKAVGSASVTDNKGDCQTPVTQLIKENTADYKHPSDSDNITYNLWSLAGKPILIRTRIHGYRRDANQSLSYLAVSSKLEYQTQHGLEERSPSEVTREWTSSYIRQNLPLIRARINALSSELMMVEETDALRCVPPKYAHLPPQSLQRLGKIITKLESLPVGSYILSHSPGDAHCQIRKAKEASKVGSYDLHFNYTGFTSTQPKLPTGVDWRPIDPAIILPLHWRQNRIPATFEPPDSSRNMVKGSRNQPQSCGHRKHRRKAKSRNKKTQQNNENN